MPMISVIHNHYHQHLDQPHYSRGVSEQLREISQKLESLKGLMMIPKEVQDLMDQAKKNNDVLKSMEMQNNALATLVGKLQTTVNSLPVNSPLSDVDKAAIVAQTSDLAAAFSDATNIITANTDLANGGTGSQVKQPDTSAADAQAAKDAQAAADAQAAKDAQAAADASTTTNQS